MKLAIGYTLSVLLSLMGTSSAAVQVLYCDHQDFGGDCNNIEATVGTCYNLSWMNDRVTSYSVVGGNCIFYRHGSCVEGLFAAENRSHGKLGSEHNDVISSFMCTYEKAAPCCNAELSYFCNMSCNLNCKDQAQDCFLRCSQTCCPQGRLC